MIYAIPFQGSMRYDVEQSYRKFKGSMNSFKALEKKIDDSKILSESDNNTIRNMVLGGFLSSMEIYIADVFEIIYMAFPNKVGKKQIVVEDIEKCGNIVGLLENLAQQRIHEITYKNFKDIISILSSEIDLKTDEAIIDKICENKCTRDLFVHGDLKINDIYLDKCGKNARGKKGDSLTVSRDYMLLASQDIEMLVENIRSAFIEKFKSYGKSRAYKEMWESLFINKTLPFDDVWEIVDNEMIKRKQSLPKYAWSTSEEMVYNFIVGVFHGHSTEFQFDLFKALNRWNPESNEYKCMLAWSMKPFSF